MYLQKMQLKSSSNVNSNPFILANKQQVVVEKDSGVYETTGESYSASRRNSACSTGCPAVCSGVPTASPNTTSSSAYSSAASTCSENDVHRRRSGADSPFEGAMVKKIQQGCVERVPFHPNVVQNHCFDGNIKNVATSTLHRCRNRGLTSLLNPDHSVSADNGRRLYDQVNNRTFEKKRLLGKGGFSRVYEVVEISSTINDAVIKVPMAAKIIDKSRLARTNQREKVDVEIELLTEVSGHPNIIGYLDSFEDKNCICILQELCNKKSLAQYLRRKQHLSEEEVCDILLQIISGLAHLHDKGIIHRDLKLGNILLTESMNVKIGDFGLATRTKWGRKKTICGTPNFIAPEVLQREGHGPEADIWSLGCLFFTLLVGKPPFETTCLRDTYRCILRNSYRIPATVSSEAADLITWMLRPKTKSRPTLSEIVSHPFFKKHSQYLTSIQRQTSSSKFDCEMKQQDIETTSQSSEEKSLTQIGSCHLERSDKTEATTVDRSCHECNHTHSRTSLFSHSSKNPIKSFTSRLHKKLCKKSLPNKETGESKQYASKISTFPKGSAPLQKTDSNQNVTSLMNQAPTTWVNKWVDYSNRYGFGYQLSSGKICVLFNDGKHISLSEDGKTIEYVASESAKVIRFPTNAVPPCLAKHSSILMNFTTYMNKNLCQSNNETPLETMEEVRLLTWCRTEQYVAMYFNNGTLQVNFTADHVKISVNSLHSRSSMLFTVANQQRLMKVYNRNEFIAQVDADIQSRMMMIHQQFHNFFDVKCSSHPFCGFCLEAGAEIDH